MSTGWKFAKLVGMVVLCLGSLSLADTPHTQHKTKKPVPLPPLPSGPTGRPVPQVPLESIKPVPPQVSYQNGQLTIVAPNSTLGDILRAVRKQTGADIEIPDATERVVTRIGPGTAREVMAELLNGSRFNYVLLGSPEDANQLTRVVLVAKAGADKPASPVAQDPNGAEPPPEVAQDNNDADAPEETPEDNTAERQPEEAEQPVTPPEPPGVKTPQQMLQEMQQRQLQQLQQQQQPPGQSLVPQPPPQQPQQD